MNKKHEIKLSASTSDRLLGYKHQGMEIKKWSTLESIKYIKRFFERPTITVNSIAKNSFIEDGFGKYAFIVQIIVRDIFGEDLVDALLSDSTLWDEYDVRASYRTALEIIKIRKLKNHPIGQSDMQNGDPILRLVSRWSDSFRKMFCPAVILACDFVINNLTDNELIDSDLTYTKFKEVVKFFDLDPKAEEVFKFCFVYRATNLRFPTDTANFESRMTQISTMTDVDVKDIKSFSNINRKNKKFLPFTVESVSIPNNIWEYLVNETSVNLENYFFKEIDRSDILPRKFFDAIDSENTDIITKIINSKHMDHPKHILLYGMPGTGKTSYASLLCKECGKRGFVISQPKNPEESKNDIELNGSIESRFVALSVCDDRVDSSKSVIIMDEADELINCMIGASFMGMRSRYDTRVKSLLNQVMDSTRTPVIWITNNYKEFIDPSCRRRFDYSVFFDNFTEKQRELVWDNCINKFKLGKLIDKATRKELAEQYPVTPGGISSACRTLIDVEATKSNAAGIIKKLLDKHCDLLGIETKVTKNKKFMPCRQYSLDGLNITSTLPIDKVADMCKIYLTKKENNEVDRSFNILFSGPSGTGKTECVKYLGEVLNKPVHVVHASSVLDMYVGNTEKQVAEAFKKAEMDNAILFMDEIDGLLSGREKAQQSWQISQVNEILCQMENFRGIFVAASNFEDNLDSASVRRFTFKFKFDYLKEEGIKAFFERYFWKLDKDDKYTEQICNLRMVAPGDFALVKMLSEYTEDKVDTKWIYEAMKKELSSKKSNSAVLSAKPRNIGY